MGHTAHGSSDSPGLVSVFRVPEFRALWSAEVLSVAGDQLARLALTVLVLQRTGSPAWSAVVYALTFLPALAGGVLFGPLADRFARRTVMVTADLLRAGLVAVMAVPGMPLWALGCLVVLVVLATSPHTAAQGALLPDVLRGDLLQRGMAVRQITAQVAQVAGFATGGFIVAVLSPPAALLINAVTFIVSAVIVGTLVRAGRPDASRDPDASRNDGQHATTGDGEAGGATSDVTGDAAPRRDPSMLAAAAAGLRLVWSHPRRRYLVSVAWLGGIFVLPEALAASYAVAVGAGPASTGLLMAADPLGSVIGAIVFIRVVPPARRDRALVPLTGLAALPLLATPLFGGVAPAFVLWAVSGACATAALVQAQSSFVRATPPESRGSATGVAASGLIAAQGVAILAGGLAAERTGAPLALAGCGVGGLLLAGVVLMLARARGAGAPPVSPGGLPA